MYVCWLESCEVALASHVLTFFGFCRVDFTLLLKLYVTLVLNKDRSFVLCNLRCVSRHLLAVLTTDKIVLMDVWPVFRHRKEDALVAQVEHRIVMILFWI